MKTKLLTLVAIGLSVAAALSVNAGLTSSAAPPINRSATIRLNILQMLQRKAPIKVMSDIPGGARTATNKDAAYFAWQEFIAFSWPNVPVTGNAKTSGPGAREFADSTKQFGQPAMGSPGKSYPALVWESTRHRSEIFTGTDVQPHGYTTTASDSWGYNSLPGYVYPDAKIISPSTIAAITPFINLDEGSQIGTCQMFLKGKEVLFMAKANYMEYGYIASRGWYNSSLLTATGTGSPTNPVASFANTSGYIVNQKDFPAPGVLDGSTSTGKGPGPYVSFPNGTLEFKAAFRIATDQERQAFESGNPIPGGYHAARIRYYRQPDPNVKTFEYVDAVGVLLSLHIIHKTPSAPYFIFATFEHKDDILDPNGNPVEDADGALRNNAFMSSPAASPSPPYLYPSAGTAPAGKYLVDATTPNVFEYPSQFSSGNVTIQQFIPNPGTNAGALSTTQSSYQNVRHGSSSTLASANSPSEADSYIAVNRRRFSIPSNPIVAVNKDVHNLIRMYGYKNPGGTSGVVPPPNVWLNYKLVNVQWIPAGTSAQKTAGQLYKGATIPVESYYLSNSLVETNMILSAFSGQFNFGGGDGFSITDFYYPQSPPVQNIAKTYTNNNIQVNGSPQTINKNVGDPFYNIYTKGVAYNMGGCMGCHGNTSVNGGSDASFILGNGGPFKLEGIDPPPSTMQERFRSYFRKN